MNFDIVSFHGDKIEVEFDEIQSYESNFFLDINKTN